VTMDAIFGACFDSVLKSPFCTNTVISIRGYNVNLKFIFWLSATIFVLVGLILLSVLYAPRKGCSITDSKCGSGGEMVSCTWCGSTICNFSDLCQNATDFSKCCNKVCEKVEYNRLFILCNYNRTSKDDLRGTLGEGVLIASFIGLEVLFSVMLLLMLFVVAIEINEVRKGGSYTKIES